MARYARRIVGAVDAARYRRRDIADGLYHRPNIDDDLLLPDSKMMRRLHARYAASAGSEFASIFCPDI